ncbi:MAG: Holliday junction branch migration protein RuvA [Clostridia bacterium]|nr:Holliday junction branch migration protein RuvA [Clostridia bacterium]MBQ4602945.1 Holliday junction branch migration protein RuvA [Clostridia bacterium]
MIYHLNGELVLCDMTVAVIDCGGVGYKLLISGNTLGKISDKVGERVKLFTYMKVSEDAVDLYGFADEDELETFKLLISVSGVGAKFALSILSLMTPSRLAMAIGAGDAKAIAKAQGVGPKIAQRIILELKDKMAKQIAVDIDTGEVIAEEPVGNNMSDAIDTLIVLGYKRGEAVSALKGIDPKLPLEDVIRLALKKLAK